jgi:hypothetical protein
MVEIIESNRNFEKSKHWNSEKIRKKFRRNFACVESKKTTFVETLLKSRRVERRKKPVAYGQFTYVESAKCDKKMVHEWHIVYTFVHCDSKCFLRR